MGIGERQQPKPVGISGQGTEAGSQAVSALQLHPVTVIGFRLKLLQRPAEKGHLLPLEPRRVRDSRHRKGRAERTSPSAKDTLAQQGTLLSQATVMLSQAGARRYGPQRKEAVSSITDTPCVDWERGILPGHF